MAQYTQWMHEQTTPGDELALYCLARMLDMHVAVFHKDFIWTMHKDNELEEIDIFFVLQQDGSLNNTVAISTEKPLDLSLEMKEKVEEKPKVCECSVKLSNCKAILTPAQKKMHFITQVVKENKSTKRLHPLKKLSGAKNNSTLLVPTVEKKHGTGRKLYVKAKQTPSVSKVKEETKGKSKSKTKDRLPPQKQCIGRKAQYHCQ